MILICRVPFSVRPLAMSIYGLDQPVHEDTEVEVKCIVWRVKPEADIYWRKGDTGPLQIGTLSTVPRYDGAFTVFSTYKVSFSRRDHGIELHCFGHQT